MTKTYNDIDAVTRLLEEKERDLELAARIGQSLLEQNKDLRQRHELLEQELAVANETVEQLTSEVIAAADRVTQLRHELSLKTGLLQIYTQDVDTESEPGSPSRPFISNWEVLNQRIVKLEEENKQLRTEAVLCEADLEVEEQRESQLINDCIKQLTDATTHRSGLQEELARKTDDNIRQQEEITQMLAQVVDLQRKNRTLLNENDELQAKLHIVKECENELSEELIEVKEKYGELLAAFQELQEEYRKNRRSQLPNASQWPYGMHSSYLNPDSLASELESSFGRDSDGYASDERMSQSRRIFETVKCANGSRFVRQRRTGPRLSLDSQRPNVSHSSKFSSLGHLSSISSNLPSDSESAYAESYHTDDESQYSSLSSVGRPGPHGKGDMDAVLTRLSSGVGTDSGSEDVSPGRCHTPDSIMSGNSERLIYLSHGVKHYHLPEKLQIVKPLEGSQTLHHWQRLATPHLGAIFESRPGVEVKGGEKAHEELKEAYSLSDYEEDEDYTYPGKSFMDTSSIYTFTNSTILHPSDQTHVTPSYPTLQLATRITSQPPSNLNSPQQHRERATSTYSTTPGLARLLNERGIYAMIPTVTCGREKIASPTPTPAPSPENSPPPTPPPFDFVNVPDLLGGPSVARGSHLLRSLSKKRRKTRAIQSEESSPSAVDQSQQTILSMSLLEKLSRLSVEGIMSSRVSESSALVAVAEPKLGGLNTIADNTPLTVRTQTRLTKDVTVTHVNVSPRVSNLPVPTVVDSKKPETMSSHSWGYVPPVKSPVNMGLSTSVMPPLSSMPNPILQLNSLRGLSTNNTDVGTVGVMRTLRKGGYI